jgi:Ca2+-binding RTX toxin-like protein
MAVVRAFLIGCAVLLVVGCAGVRSEAPKEQEHRHAEPTEKGQEHTEATSEAPSEQQELYGGPAYDRLRGGIGNDILHGLGGDDFLEGGAGDDVIHGGAGSDHIFAVEGEDVLYGGEGNDYLDGRDEGELKDKQRDEIFCGAGRDRAIAGKLDSVSSSCEVKVDPPKGNKPVRFD